MYTLPQFFPACQSNGAESTAYFDTTRRQSLHASQYFPMSLPTAAKGPPMILEDRLALRSVKVFFLFPQTKAEIAILASEIDTEAVSIIGCMVLLVAHVF